MLHVFLCEGPSIAATRDAAMSSNDNKRIPCNRTSSAQTTKVVRVTIIRGSERAGVDTDLAFL